MAQRKNFSNQPSQSPAADSAKIADEVTSAAVSMAQATQEILGFAESLETGDLARKEFSDPFFQVGQSVEIKRTIYNLTDSQGPRPPKVDRQNLLLKMRSEGSQLIFEGVFGADAQGENGRLDAVHRIPFPARILSTTGLNADNELVMVFTEDGAVHALSRQLIFQSAFSPGLPVFSKIWQIDPSEKSQVDKFNSFIDRYRQGNVEVHSHFLTRGIDPGYLNDVGNALILPKEVQRQIVEGKAVDAITHQAGAYYFGWREKEKSSESHLLGIIPRRGILLGMIRGAIVMEQQDLVLRPEKALADPGTVKRLKELEQIIDKIPEDISERDVSPLVKVILSRRTQEERAALARAVSTAASAVQSSDPVDQFTSRQAATFMHNAITQANGEALHAAQVEAEFARFAKSQATPSVDPLQKTRPSLTGLLSAKASQLNAIFLAKVPNAEARSYLGYALAGGVYFGYAYFFKTTGGYEFPVLSWIYEHGYPPVIKNLETADTAMAGLLAGVALLPVIQGMTLVTGSIFRALSFRFEGRNSRFAQYVRSFASDWKIGKKDREGNIIPGSGSSMWQLLVASCLRVTAVITYPVVAAIGKGGSFLAENILRQRSLVSSLENGINPFTKIDPASFGLAIARPAEGSPEQYDAKPRRMVNNPLMSGPNLAARTQENQSLQRAIVLSEAVRKRLGLQLALLIVAEQTQTSPGELLVARSLSAQEIQELVADPHRLAQIRLLETTILRDLRGASVPELVAAFSPDEERTFLRFLSEAKETAALLSSSPAFRIEAKTHALWVQFQGTVKSVLVASANAGQENRTKMWQTKPADIDPVQLARATSEVAPDVLLVTMLTALHGPFADPTQPSRLFGQPRFPFVSSTGLYTLLENLIAQLTLGVPSALMAGDIAMKDLGDPYRPLEEVTLTQTARREGMAATFAREMRDVHDFKKSDLGGWNTRYFLTRWSFIQYLLLTGVVLRMSSFQGMEITLTEALGSFLAYEMGKWLYYRVVWTYIRVGNMVNRARYLENSQKLKEYKVRLARMIEPGARSTEDVGAMRDYYNDILKVYLDSNSGALRKIFRMARGSLPNVELATMFSDSNGYNKFEHYGLVYQFLQEGKTLENLEAQADRNHQRIEEQTAKLDGIERKLLAAIRDSTKVSDDIVVENIRGMIEMIRTHSPLVTASHDQYHTLKVLLAGAIGTTLLGLGLQGLTTTPEFIHSPQQWLALGGASAAFVYLFGKATSAKTWTEFSGKWIRAKALVSTSFQSVAAKARAQEKELPLLRAPVSCLSLMR